MGKIQRMWKDSIELMGTQEQPRKVTKTRVLGSIAKLLGNFMRKRLKYY